MTAAVISPELHALILGIVQGLAEFLPISSSGHLIIVSYLMDGEALPLALNIALHVGTLFALLLYFWRDWTKLTVATARRITGGPRSFDSDVLLPALLIGSIPAGIIGILWEHQIEAIFHHPVSVCVPLALVGILLWWVDKSMTSERTLNDLRIRDGLIIGLAQACALIPGVSRSGSTIIGGRLLRFNRSDAARFSFLLGTPVTAGAVLLKHKEILENLGNPQFYIGMIASAVVGCLAIAFLLNFLKRFGFLSFAIYRVAVAIAILVLVLCRF